MINIILLYQYLRKHLIWRERERVESGRMIYVYAYTYTYIYIYIYINMMLPVLGGKKNGVFCGMYDAVCEG